MCTLATMLPVKNHPRSRMGFPWFWYGLPRSTRKGFATRACDLFGFACEVTAAAPEHVGACRAGMVPAARREPFNVAQSYARSEPRLRSGPHADGAGHPFQAENEFGVMVSSKYDGDQDAIVHEYDPWCPAH